MHACSDALLAPMPAGVLYSQPHIPSSLVANSCEERCAAACYRLHAVIVEQLEQECAGISSMLRDVMAIDAAAAAEAEAEAASKKRWRPALVSA